MIYLRCFVKFFVINAVFYIGIVGYLNSAGFKDASKEKSVLTEKLATDIDLSTETVTDTFMLVRISWYGEEFQGKSTASGEIFNMHLSSVAHVSMPFGKNLRFFNPEKERRCDAKINDSGPFNPKLLPKLEPHPRIQFDASKALAECLGFVRNGVIDLLVMAVPDDEPLSNEDIFSNKVAKSSDRFTQSAN